MTILKIILNIINLLYLRYFDRITITKLNTNTKIKYITLRLLIINILIYFKLHTSYFDIGESELLNIVYENSDIKFRTITTGNLNKIKNTINNMKLCNIEDFIKMASIEEIIAMKLDVIQKGGRKKDFWDLHELFENYNLAQMLTLHEQRYPYSHDRELIIKNFTNFSYADDEFNPICFRGKYWEFIKEDIEEIIEKFKFNNSF